jgi:hypothetical protein
MATLYDFASIMGDEVTSTPYTIIGDKSFIGFSDSFKDDMINQIKNSYGDSFDVFVEYRNQGELSTSDV